MKLSDYVAGFLAKQGIRHVFTLTGGNCAHLIDSVARTPGIDYICAQHEQAGAMAADAYSRVTGNLGAAISTSGPGATNMLTGVCCAYYDSVPVIYITGQVATFRMKGDTGVRQIGFQETDTVNIYKPVTKFAVLVDNPKKIRYVMEKACYLARSGRPGPVVIDIPDDIQREEINPDQLESFTPNPETGHLGKLNDQVEVCIQFIRRAQRPVVILGWGIRLAKAEKETMELVERLGFAVLPTWATMDMLPSDHPLVVGAFGTHGTRYGNFTVQNADMVLAIGCRLDTKATGTPITSFARDARKVVIDIDRSELNKFNAFGLEVDLLIHADAKAFLQAINQRLAGVEKQNISAWTEKIAGWKKRYTICPAHYYEEDLVNPYVFVKALSKELAEGDVTFVDTGCAVAWMMQAFEFKKGQKLFHAFNNTSMGYALPGSIGACFALDGQSITCVVGDGGLQVNIQEMATLMRHRLPVKIFLLNNHGYSMIQQTQDDWFGSRYEASSEECGLASPDFVKVAEAYGFRTVTIKKNSELQERIREVLDYEGPAFCNIEIRPGHRVIPQARVRRPIEDSEPLLDRREFLENMIVKPDKASLT